MRHIQTFPTPEELARAAAELILETATNCVAAHGRFTLCLAGGNTPRQLYRLLASVPFAHAMPWDQVHLFWGDERWVPPTHPDSNAAMAMAALVEHVPIPLHQVHPIQTAGHTPQGSAEAYEQTIRRHFAPLEPRFDLMLLGVGSNGLTASLFPGTLAVQERQRLVVANHLPTFQTWRVTVTLPLINASRQVLFLATGSLKAPILARVLKDEPESDGLPAAMVEPTEGTVLWFLDQQAASGLAQAGD